ncbi:translation initiation factor IF-2-like [Melozone crissalis]|uniref:translation initiation factor IF-2-like n=1 Tax=Melozone crissalis TaxID=40204 RepID=UPI0023DB0954|nr:translation initiation factor IF-2-like [Melozone crissalis]
MGKSPCSTQRPGPTPALPPAPVRAGRALTPRGSTPSVRGAAASPGSPGRGAAATRRGWSPGSPGRGAAATRRGWSRSGAGAGAQPGRSRGRAAPGQRAERRNLPRQGGRAPFCQPGPPDSGAPSPGCWKGDTHRLFLALPRPSPPKAAETRREGAYLPRVAPGPGAQRQPLRASKRSFPLLRSRRVAPAPSPQPGAPEVSASGSQLGRQRQLHSPRDEEPLAVGGGGGRWRSPDSSRDALPRWPPPPPPSSALSGACPPRAVPRCSPAASVRPSRSPSPALSPAANRAAHRPRRRPGGPGGNGGFRPSLLPAPRGLVHTLRGERRPCPGLAISSGKVTGTAEPSTERLPPEPPRSLLLLPARSQRPLGAALRPGSLRARAWRPPPSLSARLPPSPSFLPRLPPLPRCQPSPAGSLRRPGPGCPLRVPGPRLPARRAEAEPGAAAAAARRVPGAARPPPRCPGLAQRRLQRPCVCVMSVPGRAEARAEAGPARSHAAQRQAPSAQPATAAAAQRPPAQRGAPGRYTWAAPRGPRRRDSQPGPRPQSQPARAARAAPAPRRRDSQPAPPPGRRSRAPPGAGKCRKGAEQPGPAPASGAGGGGRPNSERRYRVRNE